MNPSPRLTRALASALGAVLLASLLLVSPGPAASAASGADASSSASSRATGGVEARAASRKDVRLRRGFAVDRYSKAAYAARKDARYQRIARVPQARWLTGDVPASKIRASVATYARDAVKAGRTPAVVIYALPGRDCGSHSGGGLTAAQYKTWVREIARGLRSRQAVVVLEPDALALLGSCEGQEEWSALLADATRVFAQVGAWTYLDAGHSGWRTADEMAERLKAAGVARARGFSLNVSNFNTTADERAYGEQLAASLKRVGVPNRRFLIDTSRNGAGPGEGGEWCNPKHARLGAQPRVVDARGLDFTLWVKRPGESDGACNGGPAASVWWAQGARRLMAR